MSKTRILELIQTSSHAIHPPANIKALIHFSYQVKGQINQNMMRELIPYISNEREFLINLANASYFKPRQKIAKFKEILEFLGLKSIRNFLIVRWIKRLVQSKENRGAFNYEAVSKSFLAAWIANQLAQSIGESNKDEIFIAAFLQDIGLWELSLVSPEHFRQIKEFLLVDRDLNKKEQKKIGISHAEISAETLQSWGFAQDTVEMVLHHHAWNGQSIQSPEKLRVSRIVFFSNLLANFLLDNRTSIQFNEIEKLFHQFFQRSIGDLTGIFKKVLTDLPEIAECFQFDDLKNLTLFNLLFKNPELLKREFVSYEELATELKASYSRIAQLQEQLAQRSEADENSQFVDRITGLYNHPYFMEQLSHQLNVSARYEHPLSIVLFDIDDFTLFNQTYGFQTGNLILKKVAEILRTHVRRSDIISRFGHDEFAVILLYAGIHQAHFVAEKIRKIIEQTEFYDEERNFHHRITVSAGFATFYPDTLILKKEDLLEAAKASLQQAKAAGGNCCVSI